MACYFNHHTFSRILWKTPIPDWSKNTILPDPEEDAMVMISGSILKSFVKIKCSKGIWKISSSTDETLKRYGIEEGEIADIRQAEQHVMEWLNDQNSKRNVS